MYHIESFKGLEMLLEMMSGNRIAMHYGELASELQDKIDVEFSKRPRPPLVRIFEDARDLELIARRNGDKRFVITERGRRLLPKITKFHSEVTPLG